MKKLKQAYKAQRSAAKQRGIVFALSFEEWLSIWEKSGKLTRRGIERYSYCMCRYGDTGPYSADNVYIDTRSNNTKASNTGVYPIPKTP